MPSAGQVDAGAPSRLQANVAFAAVELYVNEALVLFVDPDGPDVIVVSGALPAPRSILLWT